MSRSSDVIPNIAFHQSQGTPWGHYSLLILHVLLLAGPPFKSRRMLAIFGTGILMASCWRRPNFTRSLEVAQPFSLAWSTYLTTLEKIAALPPGMTPESAFWRIDRPAREASKYSAFSLNKVSWALVLILNMRGIRWNHQVKNIPAIPNPEKTSRARFVCHRIFASLYYLFMADLAGQAAIYVFYTNEITSQKGHVDSKHLKIWDDRSIVWSFVRALTFAVQPYYLLQLQYSVMSIAAVSLRFAQPADWPPCFGRLSETVSVRHFWGLYWHQTLRRMFTVWTTAFRDLCGISAGSPMSSYIQLWLSFLMSGVGHAASAPILPSPVNITIGERTWGLLLFFVWQAGAITVEDGVKYFWGTVMKFPLGRSNAVFGIAGYAWVVGTLWYSIPWAADVFLRLRLSEVAMLPFSLWAGSLETWVPYIREYVIKNLI